MQIVLNPDGTKAIIEYEANWPGDSSYGDLNITLKFADPDLNPPNEDGWTVPSYFSPRPREAASVWEAEARQVGTEFYDFLMNFRTAYGMEATINHWRERYEGQGQLALERQRQIDDLNRTLAIRDARIKELETDHVKQVESENMMLRSIMESAYKVASKGIELLRPEIAR